MKTPELTVFANFRINTHERLQWMKDSFLSFKNINAKEWVINIRGDYKFDAAAFLVSELAEKLKLFNIESGNGWFIDSQKLIPHITGEYVFFWIEDHFNLADPHKYSEILEEMYSHGAEYITYSWYWHTKGFDNINGVESKNIKIIHLDDSTFAKALKDCPHLYIISCQGIFRRDLFKRLIFAGDKNQTYTWPKETPFSFEKSEKDVHWLPLKIAVPKFELFTSVDDDSVAPGSSMVSRGLYVVEKKRDLMGMTTEYKPIVNTNIQPNTRIPSNASVCEEEHEFPFEYITCCDDQFTLSNIHPNSFRFIAKLQLAIEVCTTFQPKTILNLKCSQGRLSRELSKRLPDCQVTGIDDNPSAIRFARAFNPEQTFQSLSIFDLDVSSPYDLIISMTSDAWLEQYNPIQIISLISNYLVDGGTIILSVQPSYLVHIESLLKISHIFYLEKSSKELGLVEGILNNPKSVHFDRSVLDHAFNYYMDNIFLNGTSDDFKFAVVVATKR